MKQIRGYISLNDAKSAKFYWLTTLFFVLGAAPCRSAETAPARVTAAEFDRWISDISNWGRWGKDDELGTLNLITMAKRKAVSRLVRVGVSLSLELDLNKQKEGMNSNPFIHYLTTSVWGGDMRSQETPTVLNTTASPTPTWMVCSLRSQRPDVQRRLRGYVENERCREARHSKCASES